MVRQPMCMDCLAKRRHRRGYTTTAATVRGRYSAAHRARNWHVTHRLEREALASQSTTSSPAVKAHLIAPQPAITYLRPQPLVKRQECLQVLLERFRCPAISLSEPFEDGMALLRVAEKRGLEGVVSKRRDAPDRSGDCRDWRKIKTAA
jgi:hypothetical protein